MAAIPEKYNPAKMYFCRTGHFVFCALVLRYGIFHQTGMRRGLLDVPVIVRLLATIIATIIAMATELTMVGCMRKRALLHAC